jgi:site-specific DNA-adenine methylase
VENVAEVTEKLTANMADQLPDDGSLKKVTEKIEHIAEVVDNDAEKVEAIADKVCFQFLYCHPPFVCFNTVLIF